MRKVLIGLAVAAALLLGAGGAQATTGLLHITGWLTTPTSASVSVYDPNLGSNSGTYNIGSFAWEFNNMAQSGPLFCLDIFHSFSMGQSWDVEVIPIPPDPEPPYNTAEAAWIFNTFGLSNTDATTGQAVQLALWEVGHEQDWRDNYDSASWWQTGDNDGGDFAVSSVAMAARDEATDILDQLFALDGPTASAHYYRPLDADLGQGMIGEIPEPGVLILLGSGLVSFAGANWRRRRHNS